ncbi:MAG TPA: condensation domain-containing protein, partial [Acidobacteriota bacterium]|nr:condensation domain-containing protein [Acidobacteriota bacterium]
MPSESGTLLCIAVHHIVFDGWSIGVLQRELAALLPALIQGVPSPLAPLAVQYADFAAWQRQWLTEAVLANELIVWQNQLADLPPLLELPTDRPRPAVKSFRGAKFRFEIPETLALALREINRSQSATSFMVLLAAFQTLLARYTGQSDIFVGTPVANRTTVETEKLIGFFVNTLVLRTDFSGDPTFGDAVNRVKQVALAAFAHQNLPFEKLVEALQPERNLSHTPLFQVAFVYGQQGPQFARRPQAFEAVEVPVETAKFDLTLNLVETGNHFAGTIEYSLDLFDQPTMARLAGHFLALLESAAASPDLPISQLPLLTAAERQAFEAAWTAELPRFEQDRCLHTWFAEQAARTPDAIAVSIGKEPDGSGFKMRMTYRKLNELSDRLAIHLQSLGVKPETLVVLCCERSLDLVIGILGILKAGGAYVPVDPNYPTDRISFILNDTQSPVVVTQSHLLDRIGLSDHSTDFADRGLSHPGYHTTTLRASEPDSDE